MGIVKDIIGGITGSSADAAKSAAGVQSASADKAIDFQKKTFDTIRADLAPYRDVGSRNISGLEALVTDPNAQKDFVLNNPFFSALADKAKTDLFNNAAAKGKVGSGGTAQALQNSLMLLGTDILNQNITQRSGLVGMGQNAAAQTGNAAQNSANSIANLYTDQGAAQAGGIVGAQNARSGALGNAVALGTLGYGLGTGNAAATGAGTLLALCDRRMKDVIKRVGQTDDGLPLYLFRYKGEDKLYVNVMAQDVEEIMPEAVTEIDGMKHIDMEMIYGA